MALIKNWQLRVEYQRENPKMAAFPYAVWDSIVLIMSAVAWFWNGYKDIQPRLSPLPRMKVWRVAAEILVRLSSPLWFRGKYLLDDWGPICKYRDALKQGQEYQLAASEVAWSLLYKKGGQAVDLVGICSCKKRWAKDVLMFITVGKIQGKKSPR